MRDHDRSFNVRRTTSGVLLACSVALVQGQCPDPTFRWQALTYTYDATAHGLVLHHDSSIYVVFKYGAYTGIAKVDLNGQTRWLRYLDAENMTALHPTHILSHSSGDLIVAGQGTAGDAVVVRLDTSATAVWSKRLMPTVTGQFQVRSLREWPDGDIAVLGEGTDVYVSSTGVDGIYARLHPDGTVEWERDFGGWEYDGFTDGLITPDGATLLFGSTGSFGTGPWMVRAHPNALLAAHRRFYTDLGEFEHVTWLPNGDVLLVGRHLTQLGAFDVFALRTDTAGQISWSMSYVMPARLERPLVCELTPWGEALIAFKESQPDSLGVFAIDPDDGSFLWGYQYDGLVAAGNVDHSDPLVLGADGSMYMCGSAQWDAGGFRGPVIIRIDPCGGHECGSRPWFPIASPWDITSATQPIVDISWQASTDVSTSVANTWPVVSDSSSYSWCGATVLPEASDEVSSMTWAWHDQGELIILAPELAGRKTTYNVSDMIGRNVRSGRVVFDPDGHGRLSLPGLPRGPVVIRIGDGALVSIVTMVF